MNANRKMNTLLGWVVFTISLITYFFTLEPTVSFWDCGEFIAAAFKLQIGHPPGAPFFLLVERVFGLLAPSSAKVSLFMNAFSAIVSAATVLFLFWTITRLGERIVGNSAKEEGKISWIILASGFIGSLAFAFTDSFWFSAVEAEVYAFSSFFTAIVFWAILRWEEVADKPFSNRWIVLIAYLIGLSIGVHLLNLLAIPAIVLIYYFKRYNTTRNGVVISLSLSFVAIGAIMGLIIQGIPKVAAMFDVFFVNTLGLSFNSGFLFFIVLLFIAIAFGIYYTVKKKMYILNLFAVSLLMIMIGYSSYSTIMIRSEANPPMDENNPENAYNLMNYLNRTQYGKSPLFYGQYFNAPVVGMKDGGTTYYAGPNKYIKVTEDPIYEYDSQFMTFFPRMYSSQQSHTSGYKNWGNIRGKKVVSQGEALQLPTFIENLSYFFGYQISHMYIRYFMWNFVGRQNDIQGHGDPFNGNWISGIGFIDSIRLGFSGTQPPSLTNPATTNKYFFLPLLLGFIGLFFHFSKSRKDFWVVALLFFMTGIAIVIYLNQTPYQPRERDYAFTGSFYAFAIWMGLGVMGLASFIQKKLNEKRAFIAATSASLLLPIVLFAQNYDDHDRSNRYTARDYAQNYLETCQKNSVLFTYGDNDTFPLWNVQDVENVRTDVRVCCVTLLGMDWYIDQMKVKAYTSEPLPIKMPSEKYASNNRQIILINDELKKPIELSTAIKFALSDNPGDKVTTQGGSTYNYFPSKTFKITVDKQKVLQSGTVKPEDAHLIVDTMIWEINDRYITKSDFAILDLIANNNWDRPIYFDLSVARTSPLNLSDYFQLEGFAFRLVPIRTPRDNNSFGRIDSKILFNNMMNKFKWGNIESPDVFIDENNENTISILEVKANFARLAETLITEGKTDSARMVLNKVHKILPFGRIDTDYNDVILAFHNYRIGDNEKGDIIIKAVSKEAIEKINFYLSTGNRLLPSYKGTLDREISILNQIVSIVEYNKRDGLKKELESELARISMRYKIDG